VVLAASSFASASSRTSRAQHFSLLQCAAVVAIGLEDFALPLDLILGLLGNREVDGADLVETIRNIAARDLHPDVRSTLQHVDFAIGRLIGHTLGIITDRIKAAGNRLIALADLHLGGLLAHDLVEYFGLAERAGNKGDLLRVEMRYLLEQRIDWCRLELCGHQPHVSESRRRLVEVLQGGP
jgi:hypothetical protein